MPAWATALLLVPLSGAVSAPAPEIVFEAAGPFEPAAAEEIVTMDLDGRNRVERTSDGTNKFLPHFSPDGSRLLYTKFVRGSYGDPTSVTAIAILDLAAGRETVVDLRGEPVVSKGTPDQPVWSPDSRRIAFGSRAGDGLWITNEDASSTRLVERPSGAPDDLVWGDFVWSRDDWIFFTVGQDVAGCFKVRIDKMRPDGTERTKVTDGGPSCTPPGFEQSGDADPGISPDGRTVYSSRGIPRRVPGLPQATVRHLVAFSSDAWTPGKPEIDLSAVAKDDCIAGVPKVSPDGSRILLFLFCPANLSDGRAGVVWTDTAGSSWSFVTPGFGPDWNPTALSGRAAAVPPTHRPRLPRTVPPR